MHEHQERYSALVMAKLRQDNVLKDGVVFNNDYEGDPKSGAVKIPVRDQEVKVGDYDPVKGGDMSVGVTTYETFPITKDKFVNELIDGYDAASVPDNLAAERLDSAGYSCAQTIDSDGATCLLAGGTKVSIGDAVKEFSIRAIDGSDTTKKGFEALGFDAEDVAAKFAEGGETARAAFKTIVDALGAMDDPIKQKTNTATWTTLLYCARTSSCAEECPPNRL